MPNEPEIIEAEIVEDFSTEHAKQEILNDDACARPTMIRANIPPSWHTPGDHARSQGDLGGMLGGFLTLAIGFLVTVVVLIISVCIVVPFMLIMRTLGVRKHN